MATISASGIGELLTGGRTAESYILRKAIEGAGFKRELQTKEMRHGLINQYEAYEIFLSDLGKWHDIYTPIDERCGASADVLSDDMVYDIKCPYYIDTFLEQKNKLPKKYYLQVQMQMIAEKKIKGAVLLYLTSNEVDIYGNTIEYNIPIEFRHHIHKFEKDEKAHYEIMVAVDKYYPTLQEWEKNLKNATEIDEDSFFYSQYTGEKKFRKIKTASNINNATKSAIIHKGEFYYEI